MADDGLAQRETGTRLTTRHRKREEASIGAGTAMICFLVKRGTGREEYLGVSFIIHNNLLVTAFLIILTYLSRLNGTTSQ